MRERYRERERHIYIYRERHRDIYRERERETEIERKTDCTRDSGRENDTCRMRDGIERWREGYEGGDSCRGI